MLNFIHLYKCPIQDCILFISNYLYGNKECILNVNQVNKICETDAHLFLLET